MQSTHPPASRRHCPVCGSTLEQDAYRCPKCLIYFCFRCRNPIEGSHDHFQCANQECDSYQKLVCAPCTVMVPEVQALTKPGAVRAGASVGISAAVAVWITCL